MSDKMHFRNSSHHLLALLALILVALCHHEARAQLKTYESKYYTAESDLDPQDVRDLLLRADMMAVQYNEHFPALRGALTHKFKLGLYKDMDGFHAAGAPQGDFSAGYNAPEHKVIVANRYGVDRMQWGIQSHGFQQFCLESLTNDRQTLPQWLEAGLSKYFEFALFTGDAYACGVFPDGWMEGTQNQMGHSAFRPLSELMSMNRAQFKAKEAMAAAQSWAVVHYLAWGDNGKYYDAFSKYLHDISRGIKHDEAWQRAFGEADIEAEWRRWWLAQKPGMQDEGYARIVTATLVAYLGRASAQGQHFAKASDLLAAIKGKTVKIADADWLPPSLVQTLDRGVPRLGAETRLEIGGDAKVPQVIATLADHTRVVATYYPVRVDARTAVEVDTPGYPKRKIGKSDAAPAATIILQSARFGGGPQWIDVTEKCRVMLVGDMMLAPRNMAESFGIKPAQNGHNSLELNLIVSGAKLKITLLDNRSTAPFRITTQLPSDMEE